MTSTPKMMNSVKALILPDRRVTTEECLWVQYTKLWMKTLTFLWSVSVGFPKCWQQGAKLHTCKNNGNHLSVWLGTVVTSSLQSRSGTLWFLLALSPQRISIVFKRWWREDQCNQIAKNSVQRVLCWRNTKACFSMRKMCLKKIEILLKNKATTFFLGEMWFVLLPNSPWMTLVYGHFYVNITRTHTYTYFLREEIFI